MRTKVTSLAGAVLVVLIAISPAYSVQYSVTFEALWSEESHPGAYTGSAHFSPLIGTTHTNAVRFWADGEVATQGIENVAETGSVVAITEELNAAISAGAAGSIIRGRTFDSPGSQTHVFEATQDYPYITLASMIAPSPDWFVGVSSLDLRDEDGDWLTEIVVPLHPWDAGTEEGNSLSLSNPATSPRAPIRRLDLDESSLLFEAAPLGNFHFELVEPCDFNLDGTCDLQDLSTVDGLYSVGNLEVSVDAVFGETSKFDLNEDGRVNTADLDSWLAFAAEQNGFAEPYLKGDTNLNDHVGFGDFTALSSNFGTGREWSEGNYRGAGTTGFRDFLLLSRNYGKALARQTTSTQSVPEPSTSLLAILALSVWGYRFSTTASFRTPRSKRLVHAAK